jgi:hypothetical protein
MTSYKPPQSSIFTEAMEVIDSYATEHPELVGAFIQTASVDCATRKIADEIEPLARSG